MANNFCGYIAIVGRPNVGKSTLLNAILGQKIAITSHKAQTTRHAILGIKTLENKQFIYVDTPGMHRGEKRQLNRAMNRAADAVLYDVDVVLFVIEARHWKESDEQVLEKLKKIDMPVVLLVNKIDQLEDKNKLLPLLNKLQAKMQFTEIVPLSALKQDNIDRLESLIANYLPENPHFFPEDQVTDRSAGFMIAEHVREKILQLCQEEVPYSATVTVEKFERTDKILKIHAIIWVERDGQKAIIIGKKGENLKKIGTRAREDLESYFEEKIFLQLWVKVKTNWADDQRALRDFGLIDE